MRAFPGSFPPAVFDALDLARLCEAHALAVELLEAEAQAVAQAAAGAGRGRSGGGR